MSLLLVLQAAAGGNVSGTFASTLDSVTLAASGAVVDAGAFSTALAGQTLAAAGAVADVGAFATTLDAAALASVGAVADAGVFSTTLDASALAAVGVVIDAGAFSTTLANADLAVVGAVIDVGAFATVLDVAVLAAVGQVLTPVAGAFAATLDDSIFAAVGSSGAVVQPPAVQPSGGALGWGAPAHIYPPPERHLVPKYLPAVTGAFAILLDDAELSALGAVSDVLVELPLPVARPVAPLPQRPFVLVPKRQRRIITVVEDEEIAALTVALIASAPRRRQYVYRVNRTAGGD